MGPISPYGPKQFGRLTEEDILQQSENFIKEQQICQKTDPWFNQVKQVIALINIYGHRHLLDHLRMFQDRQIKLKFLLQWKPLDFKNLDLIFQKLIRKKIMRVQEEQIFTKMECHDKYESKNRQNSKELFKRGQEIITARKAAVLIFVGSSATMNEESFDKQFYKEKETDLCLFAIIMKRLEQIADKYGMPSTYIFYNNNNSEKVNTFMKSYKYGGDQRIKFCMQDNHPILNLNGNICLKAKDSGDVIEMPMGPAEFRHAKIGEVGIIDRLKQDKIEYVCCCDCQNMLQMVIDPYVLGLLDSQKDECDLMYKCTFPENLKDRTFRKVIVVNGVPKADNVQMISSLINYNSPHKAQNNQLVNTSPAWMNSLVFNLGRVVEVLDSPEKMATLPETVTYKMKTNNYWSPIDFQQHQNEACYVFQKQLSDLFINHLFKSKAILVERKQEYLPVISQKKEYSWGNGYKEYTKKMEGGWSSPFFKESQQQEEPIVQPQVPTIIKKGQVQYELLKKGKEESK